MNNNGKIVDKDSKGDMQEASGGIAKMMRKKLRKVSKICVLCDVRTEDSHDSLSDQNSCLQRGLDQGEWDEYQ